MISASGALSGSYDYSEVANSVLISMVASYAALDLAARVTTAKGGIRLAWLSPDELVETIYRSITEFRGTKLLADDFTLVVLKTC